MTEPADMMPSRYSQNDEQDVLFRLTEGMIGSRWRVLDIGAHDGRTFSNSYGLISLRGWSGVLVEPSPGPARACLELHRESRGRVLVVCAALAERDGPLPMHITDDLVSTSHEEHRATWQSQVAYTRAVVGGVSWASLLTLVSPLGDPFDVISIDVEGGNAGALERMPLWLRPRVLIVEFGNTDDCRHELAERCYQVVHRTNENLIAVPE